MSKIECKECGEKVHSIKLHLKDAHPEISIEDYQKDHPDAPLLSETAKKTLARKKGERLNMSTVATLASNTAATMTRQPLHEVFELGEVKAAKNAQGNAIPIEVIGTSDWDDLIPEIDDGYIYNIDLLKTTLLGLSLNIPVYLWGHAGVGKSTVLEQIAARTKRPYVRVQHTANTEEAHIVGQTLANETGTYFEPGPLTLAMKHGWMYNADEYDFAHPSILAVYQSVLEGKSLVIKEAPHEWRVTKPHKNFRFVATGNSNGAGDDTGLYNGVQIGNAANYSRFGIVEHVPYMPKKQEVGVVMSKAQLKREDAVKLVQFADDIRTAYDKADIGATIGPRELIYAGMVGLRKGSWRAGLSLAFINRLGQVDRETADGVAQRIFG